MKPALFLALATFIATPAFAESGTKQAQDRARSFLIPCEQPQSAAKARCVALQKQFVESYELSTFGETYFMGDLEGFLDPRGKTAENSDVTGVRPDLIEASAWRYVRWKVAKPGPIHDRYHDAWVRTVRELSPDQVEATKRRFLEIQALIMAQSWPMRAELWRIKEKVSGLEDVESQLEDYIR